MAESIKRHIYLKMKSLDEARRLWLAAFDIPGRLAAEEVRLEDALGRTTAEPVWARESSPRHHLAAMDGVAVRAEKTFAARPDQPARLVEGLDYRPVNTGHVLPDGFDAVVMIEHVVPDQAGADGRQAILLEQPAFPWQHVRKLGEDLVATELILPAGRRVNAWELGALAAGGVYSIKVKVRPRVALIPTGSELVTLDQARQGELSPGAVVEFNTLVLASLVEELGGRAERLAPRPDEHAAVKAAILEATRSGYDLVIVNAGSSAGTADHTANALAELGEVLVHGVNIMPGKPTVLGRVGASPVIGNPGYPVSAIISFEQFATPLLAAMLGTPLFGRPGIEALPVAALPSKPGLEEFIRVKLGQVGERVMAVPLHRGAGSITSLTRADGVIRVPAQAEGLEAGRPARAELFRPRPEIAGAIVAIGSHDNTLDVLSDLLRRHDPRFSLTSGNVGSLGGLRALKAGQAHLAGSHLLDMDTGEYNVSYIKKHLAGLPLKLVQLVEREQGFIVPAGNPKGVKGLDDLAREDVTFINRQAGSGTRVLLDYHLAKRGIDPERIRGFEQEEYTHMAVAAAVLSGRADVGLGIQAAAQALKLDFIPFAPELYQLVIPTEHFATEKLQALLEVIRGKDFRQVVLSLGGYGVKGCGEIVYEQ